MTDDVLFLSGQRVTRLRDADPAIAPPPTIHTGPGDVPPGRADREPR
ncbi:hypothetical protein ABZ960_40915 [Streptomyces pseudovenezuelae]